MVGAVDATASSRRMDRVRAERPERGADQPRLVIGPAMTAELQPEDVGRPRIVEVVC